MANVLDTEALQKINISGHELVVILTIISLEIAAAIPGGDTEGRIAAIANRLDDQSRALGDNSIGVVISQLSKLLIATERTA